MSNFLNIKKKLLERKALLEDELKQLNNDRPSEAGVADPTDQAMISSMEDIHLSLQKNERDEYSMILKALDMIEHGTYGICSDCGMAISEKRLQLYPNATRCILCQEAYESA